MTQKPVLCCLFCLLLVTGCSALTGQAPVANLAYDNPLPQAEAPAPGPTCSLAAPKLAAPPECAPAEDNRPTPQEAEDGWEEGAGPDSEGAAEAATDEEVADDDDAVEEVQEEPLVNEELPETNPDEVLSSGSEAAGRLKEKARAIEKEIKEDVSFDVPIVLNERVAYFLDFFQTAARERFGSWLARSTIYLPRMQAIFREKGLPEDLVYLALIESGFNPRAVSRSAAVGPWQFISATGARYGLRQDWWVDERRDPEKATCAAARYLTDLYGEFGSWYLAAAAYNCGEGRIRRAIRNYNTEDYWEICDLQAIALETRDYVPKMIAAILIAKEPEKYGFGELCFETAPECEAIELDRPAEIGFLAQLTGVEVQRLKDLNPELRRGWTPPATREPYKLRVPAGTGPRMLAGLAEHKGRAAGFLTYRVHRGDTIARVATRYGLTPEALAEANTITVKSRLRRGQRLMLPVEPETLEALAAAQQAHKVWAKRYYKCKGGDTLSRIARRYHTTVAELRDLNPGLRKTLRPGQRLAVGKKKVTLLASRVDRGGRGEARAQANYTVRPGDSLYQIAKRCDTSVAALKELNPGLDEAIHPGQELKMLKAEAEEPEKAASAQTCTVKKGDTLLGIARRYHTTVAELHDLNPGLGEAIHPGQEIRVGKAKVVAAAAPEERPARRADKTYQVRPGDTLWEIARRHNVEVSDLRTWNGLRRGEAIRPGDRLKLKVALGG